MNQRERFHDQYTFKDPDAELGNFEFVDPGKDRDVFGNRIRRSETLAYMDSNGERVKSALAISLEGQEVMKNHPHLLTDLDSALTTYLKSFIKYGSEHKDFLDEVVLGNEDGRLSYLSQGGQSIVFLLEIGDESYVVKIKKPGSDVSQPFSNEMLQTQYLARDLKDTLEELQVELPKFLFASGQVSCTKFERGSEVESEYLESQVYPVFVEAIEYIDELKQKESPLWKGVTIDLRHSYTLKESGREIYCFPASNFLKSSERIKWIDMFAFSGDAEEIESRGFISLSKNEIKDLKELSSEEMIQNYEKCKEVVNKVDNILFEITNQNKEYTLEVEQELKELALEWGLDPEDVEEMSPALIAKQIQKAALKFYNIRFIFIDITEN